MKRSPLRSPPVRWTNGWRRWLAGLIAGWALAPRSSSVRTSPGSTSSDNSVSRGRRPRHSLHPPPPPPLLPPRQRLHRFRWAEPQALKTNGRSSPLCYSLVMSSMKKPPRLPPASLRPRPRSLLGPPRRAPRSTSLPATPPAPWRHRRPPRKTTWSWMRPLARPRKIRTLRKRIKRSPRWSPSLR